MDDRHPAETLSSICMVSYPLDEHYADKLRVGVVFDEKGFVASAASSLFTFRV